MFRTPCQAQVKQLAQVQALFLGGTCVTIQLKAYCPWSQNVKGSWHQSNMAHAVAWDVTSTSTHHAVSQPGSPWATGWRSSSSSPRGREAHRASQLVSRHRESPRFQILGFASKHGPSSPSSRFPVSILLYQRKTKQIIRKSSKIISKNPHEIAKVFSWNPMVPYRHSAWSRSFPPGTNPSHCRVPSAARLCPRGSFQVRRKVLPWRGDGTLIYPFLCASVHLFFETQT